MYFRGSRVLLSQHLNSVLMWIGLLLAASMGACQDPSNERAPDPAVTALALQVQVQSIPPDVERLRASVLLNGTSLVATYEGSASTPNWTVQLDAALRGSLQLHVDGEQVPSLVRAEGDAALELTGQAAATLGVNLTLSESCASGWCWLSPLPAASAINRLWSFAPDEVWAVGDRGLFLKWDGRAWHIVSSNPLGESSIADLWASSRSDVWVFSGYAARAARWNGKLWSDAPAPLFSVRKVWGFADGSIWAVGRAGNVARFDGSTWKPMPTGVADDLSAVWGNASDDLWVAGDRGTILHFNGTTFVVETQGAYPELFALWGDSASSEVWAAGRTGTILHRTGGTWSPTPTPTTEWLYGVAGRSAADVWAYGDNGTVLHWQGTSWTVQPTPVLSSLRSAAVSSDGRVWLGGTGGTLIYQTYLTSWKKLSGGLPNFYDIWGSSERDLWIAGQAGTIYHYDGISWKQVSTGYTHDLTAIWGSGPNDIWAVGWGGPKLHWDGSSWTAPTSNKDYLLAIWGSGKNDIWTVGDVSGIAQHWDGLGWTPVDTGLRTNLYGLWGSDSRNIWTTGYGGACARWNGSAWTAETLPVRAGELYSGIFGTSSQDVWIATPLYDMLHWDGTSWSRVDNGGVSGFRSLWGSSSTDIWAVGSYGVTTHYAAAPGAAAPSWTVTYNGTASYRSGALRRIIGFDSRHIWAVGDDGTVLQYRP